MNIRDALGILDPTNDAQWTGDGAPRVDEIAALINDETVTRADITSAQPDFTRESALAAQEVEPSDETQQAQEAPEVAPAPVGMVGMAETVGLDPVPAPTSAEVADEVASVEVVAAEPVAMETVEEPVTAKPQASELELLQRELEDRTSEMLTAQATQKEAKATADEAANRVNAINRRIEVLHKADPHHSTAHIRDYLAQQNRNRLARAGRMKQFLGTSGVKLAEVAKEFDPRGPLDRAMHGRKPPRGSVRPQYAKKDRVA